MRLAIVNLTGGGFSGGYRKYLKNMLPRFADHDDIDALLCISPEGADISAWFDRPLSVDFGTCSRLAPNHLAHIPDKRMAEQIRKFSPDAVFMPVDRYVRFDCAPTVNMLRNMEPFAPRMKGDPFREILKKSVQRRLACNSTRMADHTIAVSGFVKKLLTETLRIPSNKVSLVYHGLTHPPEQSFLRPSSVPQTWDNGFLFTCGSVRPARGLEDALCAVADLKAGNVDVRLLIAGDTEPSMKKYRTGLESLVASKGIVDNVCWAGNLTEEEMRWCYDNCSLFIMTSRIEACPNIALEAMSCGCVVLSTDSLPMPEFFEDAAVYYPRGDWRSLCKIVRSALSWNDQEKAAILGRAKVRASSFSWDRCAEETIAALKMAIHRSNE